MIDTADQPVLSHKLLADACWQNQSGQQGCMHMCALNPEASYVAKPAAAAHSKSTVTERQIWFLNSYIQSRASRFCFGRRILENAWMCIAWILSLFTPDVFAFWRCYLPIVIYRWYFLPRLFKIAFFSCYFIYAQRARIAIPIILETSFLFGGIPYVFGPPTSWIWVLTVF